MAWILWLTKLTKEYILWLPELTKQWNLGLIKLTRKWILGFKNLKKHDLWDWQNSQKVKLPKATKVLINLVLQRKQWHNIKIQNLKKKKKRTNKRLMENKLQQMQIKSFGNSQSMLGSDCNAGKSIWLRV